MSQRNGWLAMIEVGSFLFQVDSYSVFRVKRFQDTNVHRVEYRGKVDVDTSWIVSVE